jgi:ATP-dependent RNA helicase RhlE
VRRVVKELPKTKRQTLLFSATMPPDIADLARNILVDPIKVAVTPELTTAEKVTQQVYFVAKAHKRFLLEKILRHDSVKRTLVFTRTKHGANRLAEQLDRSGIRSAAIHGNKSQGARERALEGFKNGSIPVLVATDLAARGIDVDGITHVVNYELPNVPEQYVHRIGRTGRAGAAGRAISFCDDAEKPLLADIEKFIRAKVPVAGRVVAADGAAPPADPPPRERPRDEARPAGEGGARRRRRRWRGGRG